MADSRPDPRRFDDSPIPKDYIEQEVGRRKTFYLLLYAMGPADRSNLPLLEQRRAEHVEYLYQLRRHGVLVMHGPMNHPKDGPDFPFRGMGVFSADSIEEVQGYAARDPMVREGFLTAQVLPFNGHPGDKLP